MFQKQDQHSHDRVHSALLVGSSLQFVVVGACSVVVALRCTHAVALAVIAVAGDAAAIGATAVGATRGFHPRRGALGGLLRGQPRGSRRRGLNRGRPHGSRRWRCRRRRRRSLGRELRRCCRRSLNCWCPSRATRSLRDGLDHGVYWEQGTRADNIVHWC